ncbi:hypothetical protein KAR91_50285 [Candidatus Pacearchaeota archaeon]|nr:hypothetical protein [Candidatus Pacearchaeota archaeon]
MTKPSRLAYEITAMDPCGLTHEEYALSIDALLLPLRKSTSAWQSEREEMLSNVSRELDEVIQLNIGLQKQIVNLKQHCYKNDCCKSVDDMRKERDEAKTELKTERETSDLQHKNLDMLARERDHLKKTLSKCEDDRDDLRVEVERLQSKIEIIKDNYTKFCNYIFEDTEY